MAGVTPEGFENKTYAEILDEIVTQANDPANFGGEFPTSPDSTFGVLAGIISASLKDNWDLQQNGVDQQNRDTAEGKYLDNLAALVNKNRFQGSGSTGDLLFIGNIGAVVPIQTPVEDFENRLVLTNQELILNRALCHTFTFSVNTVTPATDYIVNVEGTEYKITSSGSPTESTILIALDSILQAGTTFTSVLLNGDTELRLTYFNSSNLLTTTNSANLSVVELGSLVTATSTVEGDLSFAADTLQTLVRPISNITSVNNPSILVQGRLEETDEELRVRLSIQDTSSGTATKPSIEASILNLVTGVTAALVSENDTMVTDGDGIPPKSYETFVEGGSNNDIAEIIWETKPAAISTHGDITENVIDSNGDVQSIKFSRYTPKYAWVRITYIINSEETFPVNGEDLIKDAVVETGDSMYNGEDLVPSKFYGNIYNKVSGVIITNIEVALTVLPLDTPSYGTTTIPVSITERLHFDTVRVPVTT